MCFVFIWEYSAAFLYLGKGVYRRSQYDTHYLFCIVYGSGIWSAHLQRDVNQISDVLNSDRNLHMIRTFEL